LNRVPLWAYLSAAATLLVGLYGFMLRHKAEASNRAVGFAAEAEAVLTLASIDSDGSGGTYKSAFAALSELKAQGLTALTVSERTINDLVQDGQATISSGEGHTTITVGNETSNLVLTGLKRRHIDTPQFDNSLLTDVHANASVDAVLSTPIGFDPMIVDLAKAVDLPLIARHSNYLGADAAAIREMFEADKAAGAIAYLPMGDTVVGFKTEIKGTIDALEATGLQYITVEFAKTPGDSRVREALPLQTIRMHSIQGAEMDKLTPADVKDRFVKAARERQLHWLLMRPQSTATADPIGDFGKQIAQLREAMRKEGLDVKTPRPFDDFAAPAWYCVLLALAALPAMAWLLLQIPVPKNVRYALVGLAALGALGCWLPSMRGWYALATATAFPILAYFHLLTDQKRNPVVQYLLMAMIAMAGGFVVSATLIGPQWMLQNKLFVGPKLAHYAPILVAGVMLLAVQVNLKEVMQKPLVWGTTIATFGILAILLFMQTRLGNDNPAGVSGLELKFRSIMDALLYVRPRTKEFLIGNPALFVGIALWNRDQRLWGGLLLGVGAIGLTSIVNTFCHLHTPILLSMSRVGIGLVLGGIIGVAVWGVLSALLKTREGHKTA
jgi:hypothetical protein